MKVKNLVSALLVPALTLCSIQNIFASSGGAGTQEDPYLISSWADWEEFREYIANDADQGAGEYWKLTSDIDFLNGDGAKEWITPIAQYDREKGGSEAPEGTAFNGNLDGDGHVIKNYTINATSTDYGIHGSFGLFSAMGGDSVVENLGIENVSLRMGEAWIYISAGAIAGTMIENATIRNCYSKYVVCDNADPNGQYLTSGGLAGAMYDRAKIENSYSLSFREGTKMMYFGGIVGAVYSADASVQKCYSDTSIGVADAGAYGSGWYDLYYPDTTTLPWPWAYYSQGTPVGYIGEAQTVEQLKAVPSSLQAVFKADIGNINSGYPVFSWQTQQNVLSGAGTESDPYLIGSEYDLYSLSTMADTADKYFKLTADIDLGNATWSPIGTKENPFKGDFDGNGHIIRNYKINITVDYKSYGLFAYTGGEACIHNLGIENITAMLYQWHWNEMFGGLVGTMTDHSQVRECYVKTVRYELQWDVWPNIDTYTGGQGQLHTAGGLIGELNGSGVEVTRCYALDVERDVKTGTGEYEGKTYAYIMFDSGLIGRGDVFCSVTDCYSDTYVIQNKRGTKVTNSYQTLIHSEWYDGYTWGAWNSDVRYISHKWSSAFVPGTWWESEDKCFPKLKWENADGKYQNYVKEGRMAKENLSSIFGAENAVRRYIWETNRVSLVMSLPKDSHIAYDVDLTADKYYKISFKARSLNDSSESVLSFSLGDTDLTELLQKKTIGNDWEATAVYIKPTESRSVTLGIAGSEDMLIDDIEVVEVDADKELTMLDNCVFVYNMTKELASDLYKPQRVCDGVEVQYYSDHVAPDGTLQNVPIGMGTVDDTLKVVMKVADKEITRDIPIKVKKTEPIDIISITMLNSDGKQVYSIEDAAKIDKIYTKINEASENAKLYAALYKNSVLTSVKLYDAAEEIDANIAVNGADTVKVFVITDNLQPLAAMEKNLPVLADDAKVTIHTIGDSLCATYKEDEILRGWGQLFGTKFNSDNVTVDNALARGGMTAEEFISGGRFEQLLAKLQPGDYVFVQLATNDQNTFTKAEFKKLLLQFVLGAREKGAIPVFVTSPERLDCATNETDENGQYKINESLRGFPDVMREIGRERNVPVVDLNAAMIEFMREKGLTGMEELNYFVDDRLHFNKAGAEYLISVIADGVKELDLPIAKFLIAE